MIRLPGFAYYDLGLYETYMILYAEELSEWYKPIYKRSTRMRKIIRMIND